MLERKSNFCVLHGSATCFYNHNNVTEIDLIKITIGLGIAEVGGHKIFCWFLRAGGSGGGQ